MQPAGCAVVAIALMLSWAPSAHASLLGGLARIIGGVLEVPRSILVGTATGFPIVGTVFGALAGVVNGTGMAAQGAFEAVGSVVPLVLKIVPLIPIFV